MRLHRWPVEAAVFAEPAGAASLAGLEQALADGLIERDEQVVIINTGSGLKDVQAAIEVTGGVRSVDATMDAVTNCGRERWSVGVNRSSWSSISRRPLTPIRN